MDPARARHEADIIACRCIIGSSSQLPFKLRSFSSREVIATTDDVASMRIGERIEVGKEGKHFCGVTAAAEDYENACGGTPFAGKRPGGMHRWENIEEAELKDS